MNANIYPPRLTPKLAMEFSGQSATQLKRLRAKRAIRFYKLTNRSVVYCRCVRYRRVELIEAMNNFRQG